MSTRNVTLIAVSVGVVVGGGLAWLTRPGPEPGVATSERPFRPLAERSAVEREDASAMSPAAEATTLPPASVSASASADAAPTAHIAPGQLTPGESACARGKPEACVRVADGLDQDPATRKRALTFRRRAVVLYAEYCQDRQPGACHALSQMYESGKGVPKNADTAAALLKRYLEICKKSPNLPACRGSDG